MWLPAAVSLSLPFALLDMECDASLREGFSDVICNSVIGSVAPSSPMKNELGE
jgi:hypothetical protein